MGESERYQFGLFLVLREGDPLLKHLTSPTGKISKFPLWKGMLSALLSNTQSARSEIPSSQAIDATPIPRVAHDVTQCQFGNISTDSSVTCLPGLAFSLVRETL